MDPSPEDPRALELLLDEVERDELLLEEEVWLPNRVVAARKAEAVDLPAPVPPLA
ncbi:MAG TPA: hypothetical protein VLE22_04275 [Bryobacteraceae bacterium]|nr:hypothetical protein [Bryobacteraceae bacterium]